MWEKFDKEMGGTEMKPGDDQSLLDMNYVTQLLSSVSRCTINTIIDGSTDCLNINIAVCVMSTCARLCRAARLERGCIMCLTGVKRYAVCILGLSGVTRYAGMLHCGLSHVSHVLVVQSFFHVCVLLPHTSEIINPVNTPHPRFVLSQIILNK